MTRVVQLTFTNSRTLQGTLPLSRHLLLVMNLTTLLTILLPVRADGASLPIAFPPSHPKHFLTVAGSSGTQELQAPSQHALEPSDYGGVGKVVGTILQEDEVMYHFYKNGRSGSEYRKASTMFMVRLFNDLQRGAHLAFPVARRNQSDVPGEHDTKSEDIPQLTDTIRSFSAADVRFTEKRIPVVTFSIPFLPNNERLRSAEVRFLRSSPSRTQVKRYKMRLDVLRDGKAVEKVVLREEVFEEHDYDVFNITKALDSWINNHHGNISLKFKIPRKLEETIQLNDSSLKSTSLIALYLEDRDFLRHMYESYTTFDAPPSLSVHADSKMNSSRHNSKMQTRGRREPKRKQNGYRNRRVRNWHRMPKHSKCQMYDFDVDFDFIGWGQWIIHPKHFNARFCYGECPSPVDSKYKPTNHAMLQTLMRQKKPRLAPPTCCVPISLKPLSMLYFEYDEIVVRHHENMIADECGCR